MFAEVLGLLGDPRSSEVLGCRRQHGREGGERPRGMGAVGGAAHVQGDVPASRDQVGWLIGERQLQREPRMALQELGRGRHDPQ